MSDGIAYQNKDIEFKLLSGTFKEKSFDGSAEDQSGSARDSAGSVSK